MDINCNFKSIFYYFFKKKDNKLISTYYSNAVYLVIYETLKYFINIPNLITFSVGLLQSYNSYYLATLELHVNYILSFCLLLVSFYIYNCNKINDFILSGIYCNIIILLSNTNYIVFSIYRGNFVNILISLMCYILHISIELHKFNLFHSEDKKSNNLPIKVYKNNKIFIKKAEDILLDDVLLIDNGNITPCDILVEKVNCKCMKNLDNIELGDYSVGTFYDKESTGENVSKKFTKGDIISAHKLITRPNTSIYGKIHKLINNTYKKSKSYTLRPKLLDTIRICGDCLGITIIVLISIFGEIYAKYNIRNYVAWKHFIAFFISSNILIPSMRMNLLYQVYNILIKLLFCNIDVLDYNGVDKVSKIKNFTFDKTGTLTYENLKVFSMYEPPDYDMLYNLSNKIGWHINELLFALIMANNQSNFNQEDTWGISPEEVEILKYMNDKLNVTYLFNPLNPKGQFKFSINNNEVRYFNIISRSNYKFGKGKIAILTIGKYHFTIRQDGSHFFYSQVNDNTLNWCKQLEKKDSRRTISIGISKNDKWHLISYFTFENKIRDNVTTLYKYLKNVDINTNILTGDGRETSEFIATSIGLSSDLYQINNDVSLKNWISNDKLQRKTLSIDGKFLENLFITGTTNNLQYLLNKNGKDMIIYKASKICKKYVSQYIKNGAYLGDALNDSLAIKHSFLGLCMQHGSHVCKTDSDIIIREPYDIVDIFGSIGIRNLVINGGKLIYVDICWMSGVIGGFVIIGIIKNNFSLLNNSYIYIDSWNPLDMLVISSFQYFVSLIIYSFNNCYDKEIKLWTEIRFIKLPIILYYQIIGLFIGLTVSYLIWELLPDKDWSYYSLNIIDMLLLISHSYKKTYTVSDNKSRFQLRYGNILSHLDSFYFRLCLYLLFYIYISYLSIFMRF